jgi:alpha-tubulin suppressor-like RCC1 family protein
MFTTGTVLAIAGNYYTDSLCAVYNDGSIWCVGSNDQGKLGTGTMTTLQVETMVQPPGSVDTSCH